VFHHLQALSTKMSAREMTRHFARCLKERQSPSMEYEPLALGNVPVPPYLSAVLKRHQKQALRFFWHRCVRRNHHG
jgi:hypothetical protein